MTKYSPQACAQIRELRAKATPGDWFVFHGATGKVIEIQDSTKDTKKPVVHWTGFDAATGSRKQKLNNAKFMASCHPMADQLEALEAIVKAQLKIRERHTTLLRLASTHLSRWHEAYGRHQPDWLPPAKDVQLLEDITEALTEPTDEI